MLRTCCGHARGNWCNVFWPLHGAGVRAFFFCKRVYVINVWNKLPGGVNFSAVKTFKRSTQNADFYHTLKMFLGTLLFVLHTSVCKLFSQ